MNEKIIEYTKKTLNELQRLQSVPSIPSLPFITEVPEGDTAQILRAGRCADDTAVPKLDDVAKELDGFTHFLKHAQALLDLQHQNSAIEDNLDFADSLQTVLQEIEHKLERARNGSKRECNPRVIRQAAMRDPYDSAISDMSTSPNSTYSLRAPISPTLQTRSESTVRRSVTRTSVDKVRPNLEGSQSPPHHRLSESSMSSLLLGSSSPMTRRGTNPSTAVTTPVFQSPAWDSDNGARPPIIQLPPAALDWSLFCNEAIVTCENWDKPWSCKISQRRRAGDGGLSLQAELADGSYLYHDLPAFGIAIPHTSHGVANPQAKNLVTFKEPQNHKLIKVRHHTKLPAREPRYVFQNHEDHKAFQELVYGCDLDDSWDIASVNSNRETESVNQTLRLWRDRHTRIPLILFYTNKRQRSPKTYIQEPSTLSFLCSLGFLR